MEPTKPGQSHLSVKLQSRLFDLLTALNVQLSPHPLPPNATPTVGAFADVLGALGFKLDGVRMEAPLKEFLGDDDIRGLTEWLADLASQPSNPCQSLDEACRISQIGKEWFDMIRWQTVWPLIVARAWEDAAFAEKLIAADATDTRKIIKLEFGYDLPDKLDLTIKWDPKGQIPQPTMVGPLWRRQYRVFWDLTNPQLEMYLPLAPLADANGVKPLATAIADYSDQGRAYPFSCF